jgi:hypothetical protein
MGLVLWIAIKIKKLEDLFAYVDDTFSWYFCDNLEFYEPHETFLPEKQYQLLCLWTNWVSPMNKVSRYMELRSGSSVLRSMCLP